MKTVILLRHGKSNWDADYGGEDRERPLARRGRKGSKLIGRQLRDVGQTPDRILCSNALRARQTVELAAEAGGWDCPVEHREDLYQPSYETVMAQIAAQPEEAGSVLLAGHEPAWSSLASRLIGGGAVRLPTAAAVRIDFPVDTWAGVAAGAGTLIWLINPKVIRR